MTFFRENLQDSSKNSIFSLFFKIFPPEPSEYGVYCPPSDSENMIASSVI